MKQVWLLLVCISFFWSQKEIKVFSANLNNTFSKLDHDLLEDIVSELNKVHSENFTLVFHENVSKDELWIKLNDRQLSYSLGILPEHLFREDIKDVTESITYFESEYSLYMLKTKTLSEHWKKEYKRIGFSVNTIEESLITSLQNSGTFIAIPLSRNAEKLELLKSGKLDFFIGNQFFITPDVKKIIDVKINSSASKKLVFGKHSPLKLIINPVLTKYLKTPKYKSHLLEAQKRALDIQRKNDFFVLK